MTNAIVSDEDLVWTKDFGYADVNAKVPMTSTNKFRMASHRKVFAATAIMQLRDELVKLVTPRSTAPFHA